MPANPAIRAALEAAHKARVRSRYERTKAMFARGVDQELADSSADTAAAIAAFLRALPANSTIWTPARTAWNPKGRQAPWMDVSALAAAVEEAARDG